METIKSINLFSSKVGNLSRCYSMSTISIFCMQVKKGHKTAMKDYAKKQHKQIDDLVVQIRQPLSKNDRSKFNTVLIIDVHARDIIDGFVRDRSVFV